MARDASRHSLHEHTWTRPTSRALAKIIAINLVALFFLTYVMLDRVEHFFFSLNRYYMALVAAPMVILMLAMMGSIVPNRRLNLAVYTASASASSRSCAPRCRSATGNSSAR